MNEVFLLESSNRLLESLMDYKAISSVLNERNRTCEKGSLRRVLNGDLKEFPGVLPEATFSNHYNFCVKSYNKRQLCEEPSHPHAYNIIAEITKKPSLIQYTDSHYEDQELDLKNVNLEKLDSKALNTCIVDFIYTIKLTNSMDIALLRKLQEAFQGWTVKAFKMVQKGIRSKLRTVLKHKRAYTPTPITKNPNSQTLATLVTTDPDLWPQRNLEDLLAKLEFVLAAQRARSGVVLPAAMVKVTPVPQVVQPVGNPLQAQVPQISHIPIP
jgi:hypothetical protein